MKIIFILLLSVKSLRQRLLTEYKYSNNIYIVNKNNKNYLSKKRTLIEYWIAI